MCYDIVQCPRCGAFVGYGWSKHVCQVSEPQVEIQEPKLEKPIELRVKPRKT